jgi:hypothetical protein
MTTEIEATYAERATELKSEASKKRIEADAKTYGLFRQEIDGVKNSIVNASNLGRQLGISFEEYWLPPGKAGAENFFNKNYRAKLRMSFQVFCWLKQASSRLPEKCKTVEDCWPAIQMTFFAGGLIEVPQREEQQQSHIVSPVQSFFLNFGAVRHKLEKIAGKADDWDAKIKDGVKEQIKMMRAWLTEIESKLL